MPVSIEDVIFRPLNPQQRAAVQHGRDPLLIVAGAGTGKTATIVHRVAWLVVQGVPPSAIMLLTFTRRAAEEMVRRVDAILNRLGFAQGRSWATNISGGTFHAIALSLLRRYGQGIGLTQNFTVLDRSDAEDLMNVVRSELQLERVDKRFPKKGTCLDIYSRMVNTGDSLGSVLEKTFPWCRNWHDELVSLFAAYRRRKIESTTLDYDDLLLYWLRLLQQQDISQSLKRRFSFILVDEYQDTNQLQSRILYGLSPEGDGVTVVGDDAQAIYSFRGATVKNILEFPNRYVKAKIITLEQNYRSTMPILKAANAVMESAKERYTKSLWSEQQSGYLPRLAICHDEYEQAEFLIHQILAHHEAGIDLRRQAVLFRASHHSLSLEAELTRRDIPYHKYGGLKFLEAAHIKDVLAFLRLAENPRDLLAGIRVLCLLPGIGPVRAQRLLDQATASGHHDFAAWRAGVLPVHAAEMWPEFVQLIEDLVTKGLSVAAQLHRIRAFYEPMLPILYDHPIPRAKDLEQLEQIASRYKDRQTFLAHIAIDPPNSTQDLAGKPDLNDDFLVLSTIHSAKGLEWDVVYIINATDGHIPSDMATDSEDEIEEERRLFYVAMTRAKRLLYVCCPVQYYVSSSFADKRYSMAIPSRFLTREVQQCFEICSGSAIEVEQDKQEQDPLDCGASPAAKPCLIDRAQIKKSDSKSQF
ncbi:MAG: ATP-dependent helicase [Thermogutta sp.]